MFTSTSLEQYFRGKVHPPEHEANAVKLLSKVDLLCALAYKDKAYNYEVDPDTGSCISGAKGGVGDGGYRLPESKTGAPSSSHKSGEGVDKFDPLRSLAQWCILNQPVLERLGLYMEDPRWTPGWCHFQTKRASQTIYIPAVTPPLASALKGQRPLIVKTSGGTKR